jgi:TorA maturation chaperone TorD
MFSVNGYAAMSELAGQKMDQTPTLQFVDYDPAVNMARQSLYRIAACSLFDPLSGSWDQLNELRSDPVPPEAAALIRGLPEARPAELGPGERPLANLDPRPLLDRLPVSRQAHNAEYEATFGLLVSAACPPYETEYINGKFDFQRSNNLADVSGYYQAFGLTGSRAHPERQDHIALELEFMAFLLGMERQAADGDRAQREERLSVCREAQSRFLHEHLAWWVPAFAKLLCHQDRNGFYSAVGTYLAALIPAERALLNVGTQSRRVTPSPPERPEACEGCALAT